MPPFIISAAGLGSRLGLNLPKCLLQVHETCLIDYQMATLPEKADVRLVVGFREDDVRRHIGTRWPNITFVRNPHYATTSNTYSINLAARMITGPYIIIDGDLLLDTPSFGAFLKAVETAEGSLIGIAPRTTEEAVGVRIEDGMITAFLREGDEGFEDTEFEWCGVAYIDGFTITASEGYVFEVLRPHLPLKPHHIACLEIDTPRDMSLAMQAIGQDTIRLSEPPSKT